jgi:HEAT repeat protein
MSENGKHLRNLAPEERVAYLESLYGFDELWVDHGPIFIKHLDDPDPQVRAAAIEGLWYYPDPALIDRLLAMAERDPSPEVRAAAISGLGIYIYEGEMADYDFDWGPMTETIREDELPQADFVRVRDFLLAVFRDESRALDERRFALEALSFSSEPEVADLIDEAYHHPRREMVISALFGMGRSGLVRWTDILERELQSPERERQLEAIRAVGEIGLTELGEELWQLTFADHRDVKLEAILALGQTGWKRGYSRLQELTLDPDTEVAEAAQAALEDWLWISETLDDVDDWDFDTDWEDEEAE